MKNAIRAWEQSNPEAFLPLVHPRGEAQVVFRFAEVVLSGELRKMALFVMTPGSTGRTAAIVGATYQTRPADPGRTGVRVR